MPRSRTKPRSQIFVALVLAAGVAAGVIAVQRLPQISSGPVEGGGTAPSGAWLCPHGGGRGWRTWLSVANPGEAPVNIRVSSMGEEGPSGDSEQVRVPPGVTLRREVPSRSRGSATYVEFLDGFVAAGWVAQAGGGERGIAAEPCAPTASRRVLLADATTVQSSQSWIILMNPFDSPASYSLRYLTEKERPVVTTEESIRPHHGVAISINARLLGQPTVGTEVIAGIGRLAAANLTVEPGEGGVRSVIGMPFDDVPRSPDLVHVMPGGLDTDQTKLIGMNPWRDAAVIEARVISADGPKTATGVQGVRIPQEGAATIGVTVKNNPASLLISTAPTAFARRTFGANGDQGGTGGGSPATDWVLLPAVSDTPRFEPRMLIANPGEAPAQVSLLLLPMDGERAARTEDTITIPPGTTGFADLPQEAPHAAVIVRADQPVVPAFAAYSNSRGGYAVSAGVPLPSA